MVGLATAELPANWAQWWWWRFNGWGRVAASFGGGLLYLGMVILVPQMKWWTRMYITLIASTALWVLVTLATPPESPALLKTFYERVRPMGWWDPLRSATPPEISSAAGWAAPKKIAAGLSIAALGAASVMCYIVGISDLYLGRAHAGLVLLAIMSVTGVTFWRIFSPYVTSLMSDEERRVVPPADESSPIELLGLAAALAFAAGIIALLLLTYAAFFTSGRGRWISLVVALAAAGVSWKLHGRRRLTK
jgi:hypothetical protein